MSTLERRAWQGFAVVVVAALAVGWLIYTNITRLHNDQDAVVRSYESITALDSTLVSLQDVETGQRGYLLTGDRAFLAPYTVGVAAVNEALARLKTATARDRGQLERIASLEALAAEKVDFARQAIAIKDAEGDEAAGRFVASGRGQSLMDEARAVVATLQQAEADRLQGLTTASEAATRNTGILTGALAVVSVTLLVVLLGAVARSLAIQRRTTELDHRLSATAAASNDAIVSIDLEGRITQWNAGAERLFGYSANEIMGRSASRLSSVDEALAQRANIAKVHGGTTITDQEAVGIAKDGSQISVSLSAFPVHDGSGAIIGSGAVFRDTTERKGAQDALRESQQRFATVFNVSPVGISITRASDGLIIDANRRILDMLGFKREEVVGRSSSDLGIWVDDALRASLVRRIREEGSLPDTEVQLRASSGRLIDTTMAWEMLDLGGDTCFIGLVHDITARKEAERDRERLFRLSSDMIAIAGFDGAFRRVNPAALDLLGYSEEELLAIPFLDLVHRDDREAAIAAVARLARGDRSVTLEGRLRGKDGRYRRVEIAAAAEPGEPVLHAVVRDVTARKALEEALRASDERFRSVIETATDAIIITDRLGNIELFNPAAEQMFGYTAAEATGQHITVLIPSPEPEEHGSQIVAFLNKGDSDVPGLRREMAGQRKDGSVFPHELTANSMQLGDELKFTAIVRDITARKQLEDDLRERDERFRSVIETATDAIIITDRLGNIELFNPAAEQMFGYAAAEATGLNVNTLVPPALEEEHGGFIAAFVARGTSEVLGMSREMFGQRKDGTLFPNDLTVNAMRLGDKLAFAAILRDTTARNQLETELRASEERFRSVVETSNDAIVVIDSRGIIESFNHSAESMFGYSANEAIGRNVSMLVPSPHREAHDSYIARFLATGERRLTPNRELSGLRRDGAEFPIEFTVSEMRVSGDHRFAGVIRDMTTRKQLESELREATEAAQEANRAKSEFLSRMSHELRTPLNVVLGFGQVLQLDPLDPPQTEAVDHILKAGRHLLELIDEVLDISRIEAGRISLSIEPVRADELLADTLTLMRPLASQRHISVHAEPHACAVYILADRQRTRQVLLNLLANAIKYNREGGAVEIACDERESALRIMVSDTGPGIPQEKIARLFVPFDRLGAEATGVEGTGLGLSLSKYLIEAMGGAIGVESIVGEGSTFWFELPLGEPPAHFPEMANPEPAAAAGAPGAVRSVLYIEDNLSNLKLMERILAQRQGFHLLAAMQGRLGLELARDHHPDLILLDLHLPDMPGTDVLRELKTNPATRDIPVVVVSADATAGQKARLLDEGARAYLTKPIDLKEFLAVTDSILQEPR
jgi:PAS domain S-box-containing protein